VTTRDPALRVLGIDYHLSCARYQHGERLVA
jgi:hypothetical protein